MSRYSPTGRPTTPRTHWFFNKIQIKLLLRRKNWRDPSSENQKNLEDGIHEDFWSCFENIRECKVAEDPEKR